MDSSLSTLSLVATTNESRLQLYLDAEAKILAGQSVRFGERYLQRAELAEVRAEIRRLERAVAAERNAARGRAGYASADFGGEW